MAQEASHEATDATSGIHLCLFNYFLDNLIPAQQTDPKERQEVAERRFNEIPDYAVEPGDSVYTMASGSLAEGLNLPGLIPRNKDFKIDSSGLIMPDRDIMYITSNKAVGSEENSRPGLEIIGTIDDSKTSPGFLRVKSRKPKESSFVQWKDGEAYLASIQIKDAILQAFTPVAAAAQVNAECHGPSLQLTELSADYPGMEVMSDIVLALPCPNWPNVAKEFPKRHRESGWPSVSLLQNIVDEGCLIVATAHPCSTMPELEWRFSFSKAEKRLVHSLSAAQVQSYLLFKLLCSQALADISDNEIKTYHFKTLFLWSVEHDSLRLWSTGNTAGCLFALLDELVQHLADRNIPNYFIPESNLISHLDTEMLMRVKDKVIAVRRNPLEAIQSFDRKFIVGLLPLLLEITEIMKPVIENLTISSQGEKEIISTIVQGGARLVITLLREADMTGMSDVKETKYECATCALNILEKYTSRVVAKTGLEFYWYITSSFTDPFISFHEYLVQRFLTDPFGFALHGNVGCYYHNEAKKAEDLASRESSSKQAESHFKQAISFPSCSDSVKVDYANYLLGEKRYQEATLILDMVVESNDIYRMNCYDRKEIMTLDSDLQEEVRVRGKIHVPSLVLAHYLLIDSLKSMEADSDRIPTLISSFEKVCLAAENIAEEGSSVVAFCFVLLGMSSQKIDEYEKACHWFGRALEIKPDYTIAQDKKDLADAIIMSLG